MPYRLSEKGIRLLSDYRDSSRGRSMLTAAYTDLQKKALEYLEDHRDEGFVETSTISRFYGLKPMAMRGVLWSLYRYGLVEKGE